MDVVGEVVDEEVVEAEEVGEALDPLVARAAAVGIELDGGVLPAAAGGRGRILVANGEVITGAGDVDGEPAVDDRGAAVGAEEGIDGGGDFVDAVADASQRQQIAKGVGAHLIAVAVEQHESSVGGPGKRDGLDQRLDEGPGSAHLLQTGKGDAAVVDLVDGIADLGGELVEGTLQIGEHLVPQLDQPLELAAADLARDVVGGNLRADVEAAEIALGMGGGGAEVGGGGMGQRRRDAVDERAAARREHHHVAVAAGEDADVDELGETIEGEVAPVLEVGGVVADRLVADDAVVERGDLGDQGVDLVDGLADLDIRLQAEILDGRGHLPELDGDLVSPAHDLALLERVLRIERQRVEGAGEAGDGVGHRAVVLRLAEQVLDACVKGLLDIDGAELRELDAEALQEALVDVAGEPGELDAGAGAGEHALLEVDDLPGIARGVDVGDVVGDGVESDLVDLQPALDRSEGESEIARHRGNLLLRSTPWAGPAGPRGTG